MITIVELFGYISIAFAINAIRIAIKDQRDTAKTPRLALSQPEEELESFIEIPKELLENKMSEDNYGNNIEELKDKIESFKQRNRFYSI